MLFSLIYLFCSLFTNKDTDIMTCATSHVELCQDIALDDTETAVSRQLACLVAPPLRSLRLQLPEFEGR